MGYLPEGRKGSPAEDDPRLHSPTLLSPVVPGARKEEPGEVGMGERAGELVDELLGEPTVHDKRGPIYAELIKDRIDALNRFFDRGPESRAKYKVLELIGRGGMGAVFKAEQRSPVKRLVALKLVKPGYDSKEVIARFESERQALARMDHGSVAKVLDAGTDDMGRPYFVMEYVPGVSITEFADRNKLTIRQRLELFMEVCSAIAHAHSKSIIHRDIKASNVLAYFAEGKPVVKVIDFGIAKALTGDRLTDLTMNTRHGQLLGTYESMSPEQAEGSPDIDTRTDVYSLGALLYELLTGAAPFDREMFSKAADQEIRRIIREVEPPRPSTRVTSLGDEGTKVAEARQEPLAELAEELRTELEWIPLMAMRKSRDRRYATPLELADDIERYLEHRPLRAGPESKWYVARKGLRRHRFAVGAGFALFVSLTAGLAVSGYLLERTLKAETTAKWQYKEIAREVEEIENSMAFGGDYEADKNDPLSAHRLYVKALDELRAHGKSSSAVLAGLNELESSDRGEIPLLGSYGDDGGVPAFRGHTRKPNHVAVLPNFRALTAGSDGQLYLWNLLTGREIHHQVAGDKPLTYVSVSADGKRAVTAGADGKVRLWDVDTLKEYGALKTNDDKEELWTAAISPDGEHIVAGSDHGKLWLWEKKDQWRRASLLWSTGESIAAIAFPPNESQLVVIGDGYGEMCFLGLRDKSEPIWLFQVWKHDSKDTNPKWNVNCVAFSGDGSKAAAACFDGTVVVWNVVGTGSSLKLVNMRVLDQPDPPFKEWRVAFSPNGTKLAAGGDDGGVRVFDIQAGKFLKTFTAGTESVNGVAFADNTTLVSTGDKTRGADRALRSALRVWDLTDRGIVLAGAGKGLAKRVTVSNAGRIKIEMASGNPVEASFGPDGRVQAGTGGLDELPADLPDEYTEALQRATWGKGGRRTLPGTGASGWKELNDSDDGRVKFFTNGGNELELRSRADGGSTFAHVRTLRGHHSHIAAAGISPNGRFVVSVDEGGRCLGWDLLRPAVYRDIEKKIAVLPAAKDGVSTATQYFDILENWFKIRGRSDLAHVLEGSQSTGHK